MFDIGMVHLAQGLLLSALLAATYALAWPALLEPAAIDHRWLAPDWRRALERTADVRHLCFDLRIRYTDSKDHTMTRRVTIHDAWGSFCPEGHFVQGAVLRGWCHMRRGERAFHVQSIESVTDIETGESVTSQAKIAALLSRKIAGEIRHGRGRCCEPANDR